MFIRILEIFSQELRILLDGAHVVACRVEDHNVLGKTVVSLCFLLTKGREVVIKSLHIFGLFKRSVIALASKTWFHF